MSDPAYEAISKAKRQVESANYKGAVDTLEAYLATDPYNTKARLQLANIYIYETDDLNVGLSQLDIILDLDPENIDALKASVTVTGKYKKMNAQTMERYEKLVALSQPDAELYNAFAMFLRLQMTDFERSAEYYEKAIALNPKKWEYRQNYSILLMNDLKDYVKAKVQLEALMELRPGIPKVKKAYDMMMKKKFDKDGNIKKSKIPRVGR